MPTTFRIKRFNPESESPQPYFQEYKLETEASDTVLDALIKIRESVDESLTLRCSCRGAICGSCGMRINGHAALACKTKVVSLESSDGAVQIEPMNNMPVIKDLVTDMGGFWDRLQYTPCSACNPTCRLGCSGPIILSRSPHLEGQPQTDKPWLTPQAQ